MYYLGSSNTGERPIALTTCGLQLQHYAAGKLEGVIWISSGNILSDTILFRMLMRSCRKLLRLYVELTRQEVKCLDRH